MKMKNYFSTLLLAAILCAPFSISAQVTIGSDRAPSQWSLLDLCTREQQRALHNARMDTEQRDSLMNKRMLPAKQFEAAGLLIFNTDPPGCLEFWSGSRWISLCEGDEVCVPFTNIIYSPDLSNVITVIHGNSITLSVTLVGGSAPYSFQWFSNTTNSTIGGTPIDGATNATFTSSGLYENTYFYVVITKDCFGENIVTSYVFEINVFNPASITLGSGTITGRTCFDIVATTCNICNIDVDMRSPMGTNFAVRNNTPQIVNSPAPFTGYQRYVFTAVGGNVSNVRFYIQDPEGVIDQSTNGMSLFGTLHAGTLASSASVNLDVRFRTDLNTDINIQGRCRTNAVRVIIHFVFEAGGHERRVYRTINIRDCACCGIGGIAIPMRIGATNDYLTHYFMTGDIKRCWMVQNSREGTPRNMDATGLIINGSVWNRHGQAPAGQYRGFYYVWNTAQTDACPPGSGWSVPTVLEFQGLAATVNAMPNAANSPRRFWDSAPYALAGSRHPNGTWNYWNAWGLWWSSTSGTFFAVPLGTVHQDSNLIIGNGMSVRCIKNLE